MIRLRPALSCRADSLRTYPSSSMAASTRVRVSGSTASGRLITWDTVPTEIPACRATSLIPAARATCPAPLMLSAIARTPSRADSR